MGVRGVRAGEGCDGYGECEGCEGGLGGVMGTCQMKALATSVPACLTDPELSCRETAVSGYLPPTPTPSTKRAIVITK